MAEEPTNTVAPPPEERITSTDSRVKFDSEAGAAFERASSPVFFNSVNLPITWCG
jgi:hypothetical protein